MFWTTLRQCNSNTLSTCEVDVFLVITQFISFCNKQHKYSTISNIHRDMQGQKKKTNQIEYIQINCD